MNKEKQEILNAMAKIPGLNLKDLTSLVQNMPDAAEFEKMVREVDAEMEISLRATLDFNPDDFTVAPQVKKDLPLPAATTSVSGSTPVTIRIPAEILIAVKKIARDKSVAYQTWINRQLRIASSLKQ